MTFLRRFYLALLSILLAVGLTVMLVLPQTVTGWVGALSEQSSILRIIAAVVLDVLILAFLYVQVRPDPRASATGLMMQASGAITEVSVDSARARILKAVSDVPDVVSADADVKPLRGKADVELQVTVMGHDVQLPAKQKEINRALNQVIHKQLGLRMAGQPRVHIRFHGEEAVKSPVPTVTSVRASPVSVTSATQPASDDSSSDRVSGFLGASRGDETSGEEKVIRLPGSDSSEEIPKKREETANPFALNLDKEIANSPADDFVDDEEKADVQKAEEKPPEQSTSDSEKELDSDNNRT
jgi:hypothetical protein